MPAPHDPTLGRLRVSTTEAGTYNNVGFVRSVEVVRGSEGDTTLRWLGGDSSTAGDKTLEGSFPTWWEEGDTDGQEILKDAYENGTKVWIQVCPTGTDVGKTAYQFEASITELRINIDPDADGIEGGFSYRGSPSTWTEVELA